MRKFIASAIMMLAVVAVATADEFTGIVSKFEDGKITFTKGGAGKKGDKDAKTEEMTLTVAANVKFMKAKFNKDDMKFEADGEYEGGKAAFVKALKDAADKKAADKKSTEEKKGKKGFFGGGVFAQIITDGEGDKAKVTEIRVFTFDFKKKGG